MTDRVWEPSERQVTFLELPDTIFEGFYGGAAGGGKSEILLCLPIVREFYTKPKFKGIIFRRTYPQLEESLIPRSREFYKPVGGKYNASQHVWTFPSGATIRFSYLDKDDDARDHDTAEYNYAAFDELTHFTEFMYKYVMSRVRTSDPELPAIVRSASNPGNIGHTWVRERFVEPCIQGGKVIAEKLPDGRVNRRIFIPAKLTDNPHLMANDPDYYGRLSLLPEAERKAKLEGDWWTFSGQVFTEFRIVRYPDEPENAVHVIEPFSVPDWWPKVVCIDWGFSHMTHAGVLAISPDERVFLVDEYAASKEYISEWAVQVGRMADKYSNIVDVVLDPSAWAKRGDEKTIAQQFEEHSGLSPSRADNDRIGGKLLMHEYLRWQQKPQRYIPPEGFSQNTHDRIFRVYGTEAAKQYAKTFQPEEPETNLPKLQVFKNCQRFINVMPTLIHSEKDPEDVEKMDGDDPYDSVRYGLKRCHAFMHNLSEEAERRKRHGEIMKQFEETGDYNSLFRKMEKYERENDNAGLIGRAKFRRPSIRTRPNLRTTYH